MTESSGNFAKFKKFTLTYNLGLLGLLYIFVFLEALYSLNHRITLGSPVLGILGFWIVPIYISTLLVSFVSWIFCIWKSWRLTGFDTSYRVAVMAYLFGAPAVLILLTPEIVMAILTAAGIWTPVK